MMPSYIRKEAVLLVVLLPLLETFIFSRHIVCEIIKLRIDILVSVSF
jgi:hypothetical protein